MSQGAKEAVEQGLSIKEGPPRTHYYFPSKSPSIQIQATTHPSLSEIYSRPSETRRGESVGKPQSK